MFILATGMLLCILTGGNIDLSVGATCYVPDFLGGGEGLNLLCVAVGVLACAAFLALGGLGTMAWTIRLWRKHKAQTVSEATEDTNQACVSMERRKVSSCRRLSSRE